MSIKFTKGIDKDNILLLCKWSNERGAIFQEQWMGTEVSFPLTYEKIEKLDNKFSIFNEEEFIGMIQEVRVEEDNIHIGRFILNPSRTGVGLGTKVLREFIDFILKDENIRSISLTVFDFNKSAKRVYDKLDFKIYEVIETPKLKYIMKKFR
nr:GNAT family N-acetyltransferase [uncultured Lachnoanaerobaculum sp.]